MVKILLELSPKWPSLRYVSCDTLSQIANLKVVADNGFESLHVIRNIFYLQEMTEILHNVWVMDRYNLGWGGRNGEINDEDFPGFNAIVRGSEVVSYDQVWTDLYCRVSFQSIGY